MRNIYCGIADIRKRVFAEVAKLAYEGGDYHRIDKLPYEILPGEVGNERDSIFLERAIVGERIRLAMGHSLRSASEQGLLSDGVDKSAVREKYYEPPLINIIKYACHACPDTHYQVTNACQSCLAHHCSNSCPKGAISFRYGRAETRASALNAASARRRAPTRPLSDLSGPARRPAAWMLSARTNMAGQRLIRISALAVACAW